MHKTGVVATALTTFALALTGCGGNSKSNSSAASQPASTPATSASTPSSAAAGPYGQSTSSSASSVTPTALITTKRDKLGTILAYGPRRLTVYLFEGDKGQTSSCTGTCARVWPPVTGKAMVGGGAMSAELGTITRPDGTKQVTYKGHPLYRYTKDKDDGDTYGEGIKSFGAEWYALSRAGSKVDLS